LFTKSLDLLSMKASMFSKSASKSITPPGVLEPAQVEKKNLQLRPLSGRRSFYRVGVVFNCSSVVSTRDRQEVKALELEMKIITQIVFKYANRVPIPTLV
jgi:hypothetical protein